MTRALVELVWANLPEEGTVSVAALQSQLAPGLGPDDDPADVPAALAVLAHEGSARSTSDGWGRAKAEPKPEPKVEKEKRR